MSTKSERVLPLILDARRALRGGAAAIAERQRAGFAEMVAFARAKSSRWAQRPNMASHQRDELAANERSTRDDDMSDSDRSYWDKHSKNYDRSMSLLGRSPRAQQRSSPPTTRRRWWPRSSGACEMPA